MLVALTAIAAPSVTLKVTEPSLPAFPLAEIAVECLAFLAAAFFSVTVQEPVGTSATDCDLPAATVTVPSIVLAPEESTQA